MQINGSCFCGNITYRAELEPTAVLNCHCRDCQIFGGSAYRMSGLVKPSDFSVTSGELRLFEKRADSGAIRKMAFCDNCGTHLASLPEDTSDESAFVSIRIATAEQFHQLQPLAEIFTASRVPWLQEMEGCVQFAGMPNRE